MRRAGRFAAEMPYAHLLAGCHCRAEQAFQVATVKPAAGAAARRAQGAVVDMDMHATLLYLGNLLQSRHGDAPDGLAQVQGRMRGVVAPV